MNQDGPDFVEAATYMVRAGHLAGQYVASCALDKCGYLGESCDFINSSRPSSAIATVFMEQIFSRPGVPIKCYAPRGTRVSSLVHNNAHQIAAFNEQMPPRVTHISQDFDKKLFKVTGTGESGSRTVRMLTFSTGTRSAATDVPTWVGSRRSGVSVLLKLLDSRVRPGVTEAEFQGLFVKCACGLYFTRRAFRDHICPL